MMMHGLANFKNLFILARAYELYTFLALVICLLFNYMKVKFTLEQATKARKKRRGIALFFL